MEIKSESDITAESMRELRNSLGLSQEKFWAAVCVSTARGCAYEIGRNEIPAPVRRLLWMHYFMGVSTDGGQQARKALEEARASIETAMNKLPGSLGK